MTDRARWEARYNERADAPVSPPSVILTAHRHLLPPAGRALELAAGDGRNSLWLARQGFVVDAIDIAAAGLSRLASEARRQGLRIQPILADLESFPLPESRYELVVSTRYLQRSLFASLRSAVRPGGIIVFETFIHEQARVGHPKNPAFLLEPGELRAQFSDFTRLVDEEGWLETESGPAFLARLIARRH